MRTLLFTLMSLAAWAALAGPVYKWVDEDGVVHYSDQPHPNAEKLHVQSVQTYSSSQAGGGGAPPPPVDPNASQPAGAAYNGCAIFQPADQSDFSNIPSLNILVRTDPNLHPGDQVFIILDGSLVNGGQPTGTQFIWNPAERGTHTLQALIKDASGALLCQTPSVTFNIHLTSIQNPANPVRPR